MAEVTTLVLNLGAAICICLALQRHPWPCLEREDFIVKMAKSSNARAIGLHGREWKVSVMSRKYLYLPLYSQLHEMD